jgi:hypothetical protein
MFKASFIALIEGGIFLAKTLEDRRALEHAVAAVGLLIDMVLASPREGRAPGGRDVQREELGQEEPVTGDCQCDSTDIPR